MLRGLYRWLPRNLEHQLMLLAALCLIVSILGYGAYTAKRQTDLARQTVTAQMAALAQNLATINARLLMANDLASIESIAIQTATVPGIFSVLVTNVAGKPLTEVVNQNGKWSPRFSTETLPVPSTWRPVNLIEKQDAAKRDFLAGNAGKISAWHPVAGESPLGWVRVSYRLDSFNQTARDIWMQALLVIVLAIGTTLWLVQLLLRPPMRALRAATQFAANLHNNLGTKIVVSRQSAEIEALGQALNQVSEQLLTQNKDLNNQKFALDQHAIVSIADLNGCITYANDRFCDISGYSQAELIGKNHRIVKSDHHSQADFEELWQTISRGTVWHGELKNRKKDGSHYWVDATIVPLMGADGLPQQYIGIRTDITTIKDLEQSLQIASAKAEAANQAKSEFLANMSHEIRTPMNGVIGMTELALDTPLDATQRSYLTTLKNSAQSLMVILNDILDFSKIEAGKLQLETIEFSLAQTTSEILQSISVQARQKGLALVCQLAPDLPDRVLGDPGRIRQILTNLCNNAIKFTARGSVTVSVQCTSLGEDCIEAHLSVRDTGVGIPAEKQQGIFEAFNQADTSTTRQFGGTGLGLSISTRLSTLMGGRIWLESQPEQGSTFHFTVRLGRCMAAPSMPLAPVMPAETKTPVTGVQRPLRVLLAEDHPVNQMLATVLLEKWGHKVVLAENGQLAVDLFPTADWDIVLMDMQMPVMDGLEATTRIRALESAPRRTPIIAVTANAMPADRQTCLQAGMDEYLSKPIKPDDLQAMLARFCPSNELEKINSHKTKTASSPHK